MKTLHLTNSWHSQSGGIRTFYLALFEAAERHGHSMRVVVPAESSWVETVGRYGLIYHVSAPRAPISPSYRVLYPHRFLLPGSDVNRILAAEQPDLVEICDKFTMNYLGGLLRVGLLPGIRFRPSVTALSCERLDRTFAVYAKRGSWWKEWSGTYLRWLYFPMADHHVAVSAFVADELRAVAAGHKVRRGVWVRPMGVDSTTFGTAHRCPAERSRLLALTRGDEQTILLVYAGRLAHEKDVPLLLETMHRLDGVVGCYRLLLVGEGNAKRELQREAEERLPGLIHFLPHQSCRRSLAKLLAACDIFLHPNSAEPFGIAPLEAMATGLPLVAPNCGGVLSYASQECAWLVPPKAEAFAAAVREIGRDAGERQRRIARARAVAEAHDWSKVASSFLDLYAQIQSLVQRRSTPAAGLEAAFYSTP